MPDSIIAKTYVRPDKTAVLTCKYCGYQRVVLADLFKGRKHELKAKCICQNVFTVNLEFRKRVRKKVNLRGTYINHSQKESSGSLVIQDISVTGFGLAFNRSDIKNLKAGDIVSVEFTLDDEHKTKIRKEVIIRDIRENSVGCEFKNTEDAFGSPLGYYIMSNNR